MHFVARALRGWVTRFGLGAVAAALSFALVYSPAAAWPTVVENLSLGYSIVTNPPSNVATLGVECGIDSASTAVTAGNAPTASKIGAFQNLSQYAAANPTAGAATGRNYPNSTNAQTATLTLGTATYQGAVFKWTYFDLPPTYGTIVCQLSSATETTGTGKTATTTNVLNATSGCSISAPPLIQAITPASGNSQGFQYPAGVSDATAGYYSGVIGDQESLVLKITVGKGC
jgi:hypothetical protein